MLKRRIVLLIYISFLKLFFSLQTASANDDANLYNDGLSHSDGTTGSAAQNKIAGTWTFVVPSNAPSTLYYRCQHHAAMIGTINISGTSASINAGNYDIVSISGSLMQGSGIVSNIRDYSEMNGNLVKGMHSFVEGSGGVIAALIIKAALVTHNKMSTFSEAGVSQKI